MSAILETWLGGRGVRPVFGAETGGSGGPSPSPAGAPGPTDEQLAAMSARALIAELNLPETEFNPDLTQATFPGPIAEAYYWSDADIVGIQGPVGSGKTTTKMRRKLRRAREMPPSVVDGVRRYKVIFVRHTYRQLWSTTIPSYLETFPKSWGEWSGGRGDPVTHRIRFDDGHGPIEFVAEFMAFGDDLIASMRGLQCVDLDLNEADTMPVEILGVGIGRIKRWPAEKHFRGLPRADTNIGCIDCDFNAPDEENWTYELFHDETRRAEILEEIRAQMDDEDAGIEIAIEFYNQPGYGEPGCENLQNLKKGYYPAQLAANKLVGRGDLNERLVYNRITYLKAGDPVFEREFAPQIHVSQSTLPVIAELPLLVGLDQGFKGAAVIGQFRPPHQWRILAELFFPKERLMARVFGERLGDLIDGPRFGHVRARFGWGDMAGEHGASQAATENMTWNRIVSQVAGLPIKPQRIGTNRIQPRLEAVRAALEAPVHAGEPGLLIDPACKSLIRAFQARYVWKEDIDHTGDKRKIPDKSVPEANVMDALQYLLLSEVRGDGTSTSTIPHRAVGSAIRRRLEQAKERGLQSAHNILNPYGD